MPSQVLKAVFVALFVSLLFMFFLSGMTFAVMGIEFSASFGASFRGITEIVIPPVGSISAQTHLMPVKINLILQNINIEKLQELIQDAPLTTELTQQIKDELQDIAILFVLHLFLLAALGGMFGAILVSGKTLRTALYGAAAGAVLCLVLTVGTVTTFQPEKLRTPEYNGALKAAPWAIDMAEAVFQRVNILGEQMQLIAKNLYTIFEQIDKAAPLSREEDALLVLHVSDIHNNPAAHQFIRQIVSSFPVNMIIDTGDITDYGTPLEAQLLGVLNDMMVPYLFIPGNHDSPQIIRDMAAFPMVQVLSGGIVDIQGLRILALADPSSETGALAVADQAKIDEYKARLKGYWDEALNKPHLIAVHNYIIAEDFTGIAPLIIYGHTHQYTIAQEKGTILVNAGTAGAAGIRGLQAAKEIPYSVVLLHFSRDENGELFLYATDTIRVYNMESGFILERKVFSG